MSQYQGTKKYVLNNETLSQSSTIHFLRLCYPFSATRQNSKLLFHVSQKDYRFVLYEYSMNIDDSTLIELNAFTFSAHMNLVVIVGWF